ncbi:MAG: hypothetical protein EA400_09000 [Chromatiaceae bacterium]|nr:MAG: hypothetical protein EA400_09000 [Chromatiaceae bacterium]
MHYSALAPAIEVCRAAPLAVLVAIRPLLVPFAAWDLTSVRERDGLLRRRPWSISSVIAALLLALTVGGCGADLPGLRRAAPATDPGDAVALVTTPNAEPTTAGDLEHPPRWESTVGLTQPAPVTTRIGPRAAMRYFPTAATDPAVREASDPQALAGEAEPGYALYTFILVGAPAAAADNITSRELLRVIETYVLAAVGSIGPDAGLPRAQTHAFLVPVRPERSGADLLEQADPALAAPLRAALVRHLQVQGHTGLASRLEQAAGPFLITAADPALIPADWRAPRLVVDLSDIGPEYMYAVVDVYDRPVAAELAGTPDGLLPVQQRLLGLFPESAGLAAAADVPLAAVVAAPAAADWVFLVGTPPAATRSPANPADPAAAPSPSAAGAMRAAGMLADGP